MQKLPLITIITVVYNGETCIEQTIKSVISQTFKNIQYIIIDGLSTDNTINLINKYKANIDRIVSEQDNGLFDAMNKGIHYANGKWINFLNCGDTYYSSTVIEQIFKNYHTDNVDLIYGDVCLLKKSKIQKTRKSKKINKIWRGMPFCHQCAFYKTEVLKKYKFRNELGADFFQLYSLYKKDYKIHKIDLCIANYLPGGLSEINRYKINKKQFRLIKEDQHGLFLFFLYMYYFLKITINTVKYKINMLINYLSI